VDGDWEFGGHADAAAKSNEKGAAAGGEVYVEYDIEIYQMTEAGIALQATVAGTYFRESAGRRQSSNRQQFWGSNLRLTFDIF
jgi:hypothetical protein